MNKKVLFAILLVASLAVASVAAGADCPTVTPLGAITGLTEPSYVAIDSNGDVYITQNIRNLIRVYSASGRLLRTVKHAEPLGIAVDDTGIYVGSTKDYVGTLTIYDKSFNIVATVKTRIITPVGIATSEDKIYVTNPTDGIIKVYDKRGNLLTFFGGDGDTFVPVGLARDPLNGDLYASNNVPAGILVFDKDGKFLRKLVSDYLDGGLMSHPRGVARDAGGRLFIPDIWQFKAFIFDETPAPICSIDLIDTNRPTGAAMGPNKVLYITDREGEKVVKYGIDDYVLMSLSTSSLSFAGQGCGSSPQAQQFSVKNDGAGILNWTASANASWISLSNSSGAVGAGDSQAITVNIDTAGLDVGTHSGAITVTSVAGSETVSISLEILSPPVLAASPSSFAFTVKGANIPPAESLSIELSGDSSGLAEWTAEASSQDSWLKVTPSRGPSDTPALINLSVDVTGLAGGEYEETLTVSAGCASGSPISIPVTLSYVKGGTIKVSSNIAEASYQISGPVALSGSGTVFLADGVAEGAYTITFNRVPGFKTPASYSLNVTDGSTVEFAGNYADLRKAMKIVATPEKGAESANDELKIFEPGGALIRTVAIVAKTGAKASTSTACGDVNGDGAVEVITASGRDSAVSGYDSAGNSIEALKFSVYKRYGGDAAVADLDGDGIAEMVVGAAPVSGNPAEVRVFSFKGGAVSDTGIYFLAYRDRSGVNVAAGDVDGDGIAEILTTPGGSGKATVDVRIWKVNASSGAGAWTVQDAGGFTLAASLAVVDVAAGDVDGDGVAEIVVATSPQMGGRTANITAFRPDGTVVSAFEVPARTDVCIAVGDTDFDGLADIVVGDNDQSRNPSRVRVFDAVGNIKGAEFKAFDNRGILGVRISLGEVGQ